MKNYLFTFFLLFTNIVTAQNYIFDSDTKKPIAAIHILINQNEGLITNDDGYFELPKNTVIDTLHFYHLSYKSKKILLSDYNKNDTIFLDKAILELDEIVLNSINAKEVVINSIKNIDKNYINTPHNLFGFFRQSLKENSKGIEMIEVEFINYTKDKNISTKIIKARRTDNYSKWGLITYGGVSAMIEKGDFVRQKTHFLDINKINDYKFIYEGKIKYEGLNVYKISFTPINDNNLQNLRKGVLYIDSNSYAIIEIRYMFDKEKLLRLTNEQSKVNIPTKKPLYILKGVENVIKYNQLSNKKWSLYYIDFYNLLHGVYKKETNDYNLRGKLIINNSKILNAVKVKTNYSLSKDFNKSVKKFKKLKNWSDTYKFSLSNEEKEILKDINNNKNK